MLSHLITFADALMRRAVSASAAVLRPVIVMTATLALLSLLVTPPAHAQWVKGNTTYIDNSTTPPTDTLSINKQYGTVTSSPTGFLTSTSNPADAPQPYGQSSDGAGATVFQYYDWTGAAGAETSFQDTLTRHIKGNGYYALSSLGSNDPDWRKEETGATTSWDTTSDLYEYTFRYGGSWIYGPRIIRSKALGVGSRSQTSSPSGYAAADASWGNPSAF